MSSPFDPKPERPPFGLRVDREGRIDEDHPRPPSPEPAASPMSRHAAEWGLASLLGGGIVLLCIPVFSVFDLLYWVLGRQVVSTAKDWAMGLVYIGAVGASILAISLAAASLAIGIRALVSASRRQQPAGLALAGTLMSAAALLVTTCMAVGSLMIILTFCSAS
jgi:hypothetical protein